MVRLHGAEAIAASQRARVCEGHLESMLLKKNSILILIICNQIESNSRLP